MILEWTHIGGCKWHGLVYVGRNGHERVYDGHLQFNKIHCNFNATVVNYLQRILGEFKIKFNFDEYGANCSRRVGSNSVPEPIYSSEAQPSKNHAAPFRISRSWIFVPGANPSFGFRIFRSRSWNLVPKFVGSAALVFSSWFPTFEFNYATV